jgi:hypothetical protein
MVGCLLGCGGGGKSGGDLSFDDMCDQGATAMCEQASKCGSPQPKAECIAQGKALFCAGGEEQFCGVGMTVQPSKAAACLDALDALTCLTLSDRPTACTAEVLCASSSGSPPQTPQGTACKALESRFTCDPKASLCYAAGDSSSCASNALCVGDSKGMTCAAPCEADADCLSAGAGLLCLQGCTKPIMNGFCVKAAAKAKFMQYECRDSDYADAPGTAGWIL